MSDIVEKWGKRVAERGFAQVPNYLLQLNRFVDEERRLSPVEILVLMQLVGSWWKKDVMPFPGMATLAVSCGVSERQIHRAINRLEKNGLIKRVKRRSERGIRSTNAYDLQHLIYFLEEVAKTFPNDFPRNVDRAKIRKVSDLLRSEDDVVDQTITASDAPETAAL